MKASIFAILILSPLVSLCQINKGAILLEGSVSLSSTKYENEYAVNSLFVIDEQKYTSFAARPRIGFFTSESFLLGIGINYELERQSSQATYMGTPQGENKQKRNTVYITPYVRKYIKLNEKLYFTLNGNVAVGMGRSKYNGDEVESDIFAVQVNASPGVAFFLSDKFALMANFGSLYYNYTRDELATDVGLDEDPKNTTNNYGFSFQINTLYVGVQYFLRNKTE